MATIASAYVELLPSFRGGAAAISKDLDPAVRKASASAGDSAGKEMGTRMGVGIKSLVGPAIAAVGVAQVADFFKGAIGASSDLNETVNKSNVIFGQNAAVINKWASGAAKSLGLSKQAALESAAGFGNMFSQLGFGGDEAANMSKSVVNLAADLGSFNNLPTEDVAQRMAAAFRGEFDSLQALIPNINAARVEQEALAMTGKDSAKQLTAQEKAAATLAIVQKDGAAAAGDFAETSGGLANAAKIAGAQFDELKASIGDRLAPVMSKVIGFISDKALPAIGGFIAGLSGLGPIDGFSGALNTLGLGITAVSAAFKDGDVTSDGFVGAMETVGVFARDVAAAFRTEVLPRVTDFAVFVRDDVIPTLISLGGWIVKNKDFFVPFIATIVAGIAVWRTVVVVMGLWTAAQALLNVVMAANPVGIVIIAIAALVAGVVWAYKNSDTFREKVDLLWAAIKIAAEWVKDLGVKVGEWIVDKFTAAKDMVTGFIDAIKDFKLPAWVQAFADAVKGIAGDLGKGAKGIPGMGDGPGRAGTTMPVTGGNTLKKVQAILPAGARITSTYRTPALNRAVGGVASSYHIDRKNPAVDIGGSTAVLDQVYNQLRAMGGWRELLWRVPGHFDHVHVAHSGGPVESSWPTMAGLARDERPAILQVGEQVIPKGGAGGVANHWTVNNYGTPLTASQLTFAERSRAALDPNW